MPFSDTTNKSGLIQDCEFWTNLGDAGISGDTLLLAQFTTAINAAYDEVLPIIFASDAKWQWDDPNHTDMPIATTDLVSGQADYSFVSDEEGASVLEISEVFAADSGGTFRRLDAVDASTDRHEAAMLSGNSDRSGSPRRYDKLGTAIFLDPVPDYASTGGLRAVFKRTPAYFASSDTTKKPGIPRPFHRLLSLIPARDYVAVHKSDNTALLETIMAAINERKGQLSAHMARRSGDERTVMRPRTESAR